MTDYCAGCGEALKKHPVAGNYACCAAAYWSTHEPLPKDQAIHSRMTGLPATTQVTFGGLLHLYRPAMDWA